MDKVWTVMIAAPSRLVVLVLLLTICTTLFPLLVVFSTLFDTWGPSISVMLCGIICFYDGDMMAMHGMECS